VVVVQRIAEPTVHSWPPAKQSLRVKGGAGSPRVTITVTSRLKEQRRLRNRTTAVQKSRQVTTLPLLLPLPTYATSRRRRWLGRLNPCLSSPHCSTDYRSDVPRHRGEGFRDFGIFPLFARPSSRSAVLAIWIQGTRALSPRFGLVCRPACLGSEGERVRSFVQEAKSRWRRVLKSLNLVEFLVKNGSERIIDEIRRDQYKVTSRRANLALLREVFCIL